MKTDNELLNIRNIMTGERKRIRRLIYENLPKDKDGSGRSGGWVIVGEEQQPGEFTADLQAKVTAAPVIVPEKKNVAEESKHDEPAVDDPNTVTIPDQMDETMEVIPEPVEGAIKTTPVEKKKRVRKPSPRKKK